MTAAHRWQDWTSFVAGLWLALSPLLLNYDDHEAATWNAVLAGIALALAAHFEACEEEDCVEWFNVGIGLWLIAAPFLLGFADHPAAIHCVLVGVLAAALAASTLGLDKSLFKRLHSR